MFDTSNYSNMKKIDSGVLENMKHSHVFMRFPDGREKALTFSFDDGVAEDIWLVELLENNGMKGTFNINAGLCTYDDVDYEKLSWSYFPVKDIQKRIKRDELLRIFSKSSMEIACHGYTHAQLNLLDSASIIRELIFDRTELERLFKRNIRGFAYPMGVTNDLVISHLKQCGFMYARLAGPTYSFNIPDDPYKLMPSCHYLDDKVYTLAENFISKKVSDGVFDFNTNSMLMYIWGHGYEMRSVDDFNKVERLVKLFLGRDDIWYPTSIEFFEYKKAFDDLVFGVEREFVKNIACIPVWIYVNGKTVMVPPGETIDI